MLSLTGRPPSGTYDLIVVSPHMDDAVYGVGGRIAQLRRLGKRVLVVTLFGPGTRGASASAHARQANSHPRRSEVVSDVKANLLDYRSRCDEERAALGALDVDSVWLDLPELIFRKHSPGQLLLLLLPVWSLPWSTLHDDLQSSLGALCDAHLAEGGIVSFPLAVGFHPDHRVACDVGRALHAHSQHRVEFYEDVPYNHARPLRALRLRSLGVRAELTLVAGTSDITRVMFRGSRLRRWGLYLPLASHLLVLALLQRVFSLRDLAPHEPAPEKSTHDITDVIEEKVSAMRKYPSQTSMFFHDGAAIFEQLRRGGNFEEHSWRFAPTATR